MSMIPRLYAKLLSSYGHQGWWPLKGKYDRKHRHRTKTPTERFEIAVGAILTQNTSWTNVDKSLTDLRKAKKLSREAILKMPNASLAKLIRSAGYHNQKAKKLKVFAAFKGQITRDNLLSLWGVGEETADSILLYAYDEPIFVVDAYTKRIFSRIGVFAPNVNYEKVQQYFHKQLPSNAKIFNEYHALIVQLAKTYCKATPLCTNCPAKDSCKIGKKR